MNAEMINFLEESKERRTKLIKNAIDFKTFQFDNSKSSYSKNYEFSYFSPLRLREYENSLNDELKKIFLGGSKSPECRNKTILNFFKQKKLASIYSVNKVKVKKMKYLQPIVRKKEMIVPKSLLSGWDKSGICRNSTPAVDNSFKAIIKERINECSSSLSKNLSMSIAQNKPKRYFRN